jgi:hypothetical protein
MKRQEQRKGIEEAEGEMEEEEARRKIKGEPREVKCIYMTSKRKANEGKEILNDVRINEKSQDIKVRRSLLPAGPGCRTLCGTFLRY